MNRVYWKIFKYEANYWFKKISFLAIFKFLVYLVCTIIIGFSDTKSFFQDELVNWWPHWKAVQNTNNITAVSVLTIVAVTIIEIFRDKSETRAVHDVIEAHLVPAVNVQLHALRSQLSKTFKIPAKELRLCLFLPVRLAWFKWRFQIICKTDNIPAMEEKARFQLDEGAIGYSFLKTGKHNMDFVELVTPGANIPKVYKDLTRDNHNLISKDLKAIMVAVASNHNVAGLLALDTTSAAVTSKLKDPPLHDTALNWLVEKEREIDLLWRMKNNV